MVRNGFTVIEMLVTIAIIAILAALIATAAVTMGESGRRAQAEMDISTLYKALGEYKFKYGNLPICSGTSCTGSKHCNHYNPVLHYNTGDDRAIASNLAKLRLFEFDHSRVNASHEVLDPWGIPYVWREEDPSAAATHYDEIMVGLPIVMTNGGSTVKYVYFFSTGNFDTANTDYSEERANHWVYLKGGK